MALFIKLCTTTVEIDVGNDVKLVIHTNTHATGNILGVCYSNQLTLLDQVYFELLDQVYVVTVPQTQNFSCLNI